jgi:phosphopantothenoylcysteine decarboxylase/phosphopantothenate--cysteine ligase
VLVGFAAETDHLADRARAKLEAKGVDLHVANDVAAEGAGFGHETNAVTIFHRDGALTEVPLQSKKDVARAVLRATLPLLSGAVAQGPDASREDDPLAGIENEEPDR